jgi:hypothetical protein
MRKPPIPRAVPHRRPSERWLTAGACGVLALGHATRAAVDAPHAAYLAVLDTLGLAAAVAVAVQLWYIDDELSWLSAIGVSILLGVSSVVALTVGLPGATTRYPALSVLMLAACASVISQAVLVLRRPELLRTRPRAHHAAQARRGRARGPAARPGPERPAA